jgi:hypothetical protein
VFTGGFHFVTPYPFFYHAHQLILSRHSRTSWPSPGSNNPNVDDLRKNGTIGREGYINVAEQFGLSPKRGTNFSLYFALDHSAGKGFELTDNR